MAKNNINGADIVSSLENQANDVRKDIKSSVIRLANGWVVYPIKGAVNSVQSGASGIGVVIETDKGSVFAPNSKLVRIESTNGTFIRWEVMSCYKDSNGSRPELQSDVIVE